MKRPLTFTDGIGVGIGALGMLVVLCLAAASSQFEAMYREMSSSAHLPEATKLMFSPLWRLGVPAILLAAFVVALVVRPHRYLTLGVAGATFATAAIWLYGLYAPIFALSGNIGG